MFDIWNMISISKTLKRSVDLAGSTLGLWLAAPAVLTAAVAVKLDSKGPVLFRSPRVGLNGKRFHLYKLRTMRVHEPGLGPEVTAGGDERITRVGRILRKTKIDELPQLLNVLKGEVSLVGPRPEAPRYVEKYPEQYEKILSVKPGLSDRATLEFVGEEEILAGSDDPEKTYVEEIMPRKMAHYLRYVDNQSLGEDLAIIVETAFRIASRTMQSIRGKL
jgi:lipopolysaccharide/colanic/teichoic acid biosynthesis glycosyltransferase